MANKRKQPFTPQQAEQALKQHERQKPTPPPTVGVGVLSDATPQAIPKFIKEYRLRSLGIITPEGEEILTNGIKHKSSILNKGYSGEATQRYRVGEGNQSYDVPITTCIFTQPDVAYDAFGAPGAKMRGTGAVARGLLHYPTSTQGFRTLSPPTDGSTDPAPIKIQSLWDVLAAEKPKLDLSATNKRYRRWISDKLNHSRRSPDGKKTKLKLSQEAKALWFQGFNECEVNLRPGGRYEHFNDHASKLPDQWLRVAAIIHCYNYGTSGEISSDTLREAIGIVNVFSSEFEQLFAPITEEYKKEISLQKYLNDKRQQQCRYLPKKVITANGPLRPVSCLDVALYTLAQRGEIAIWSLPRQNSRGQATRPITIVDLNPQLPTNEWDLYQAIGHTYQLHGL